MPAVTFRWEFTVTVRVLICNAREGGAIRIAKRIWTPRTHAQRSRTLRRVGNECDGSREESRWTQICTLIYAARVVWGNERSSDSPRQSVILAVRMCRTRVHGKNLYSCAAALATRILWVQSRDDRAQDILALFACHLKMFYGASMEGSLRSTPESQ